MAASKSGIERHLHSVPLPTISGPPVPSSGAGSAALEPTAAPTNLTDVTQIGYHAASFSPQAGYYVLTYRGPLVPWQKVIKVGNSCESYLATNTAWHSPVMLP